MKWLAGGLTFVNLATVSGLLVGMLGGGLSRLIERGLVRIFGQAAARHVTFFAGGLTPAVAWMGISLGARSLS